MSAMYTCECGDEGCRGDCDGIPVRDPNEVTLEQTPEAFGIGPEVDEYKLEMLELELFEARRCPEFPYSEGSLRAFIQDVMKELRFPMSKHLRAALLDELEKWMNELKKIEAADRAPRFAKAMAAAQIMEISNAR